MSRKDCEEKNNRLTTLTTLILAIARGQFYYGWTIVAASFVTVFMLMSSIYVFGVFFKPMSEELGLTRALYAGVLSFGSVVGALVSPLVGPTLDKRGARELIVVGAVIFGTGYVALSLVQSLLDFSFVRGVVVAVGFAFAGNVSVNVAISNWFIRKRGKAVAIGIMGSSLGGVVLTPLATYLIMNFGWRTAWVILGVAVWIVIIPPVALFVKRRPEDVGLLPDGDRVESRESIVETRLPTVDSRLSTPREETWTRSEALRTSVLWLTILAFGLGTAGAGTMPLHLMPFLTDIGLTATVATAAVTLYALMSFSCKLGWGALIDRTTVRFCAIAFFAFAAVAWASFVVLAHWPSFWLTYVVAVLGGIAAGGTTTVQEVYWASYFGRPSLGIVRTIAAPFSIFFSAGPPFFAGWVYDSFGDYQFAFAFITGASALAVLLIYLSRPPKKRAKRDGICRSPV